MFEMQGFHLNTHRNPEKLVTVISHNNWKTRR